MAEYGVVSLGVAASIGPGLGALIAPLAEAAGFRALWVNDTPGADSLAVLDAASRTSERLILATGVLPVDRRPAAQIGIQVETSGIPQWRLVLGIGSGQTIAGGLRLVTDAATELHNALTSRIVVGALGPRMRRLAVRASDGVLLSWLTPAVAAEQAAEARSRAPRTHVALYVRTALDPAARPRLRAETTRYAGYRSYAANLARHDMNPDDTVLDAALQPLAARLHAYRRGVDEVILRAIVVDDTLEGYRRFIDDARPLLRGP